MSPSSTTVQLAIAFALTIGILNQVSFSTGECCRDVLGCCGKGPCNMFCCNCDKGCRNGCGYSILHITEELDRRKRQVDNGILIENQVAADYEITWRAFNDIDLNKDQTIDLNEGLSYLQNMTRVSRRKLSVQEEDMGKFVFEFGLMDANGNGVLEPHEFDGSLA